MEEDNEVRTWDIEKLWNFISAERDIQKRIYNLIRFGHGIKMDIYDYIRQNYDESKLKRGIIIYRGKRIKTEDLYSDIEMRRITAIEWIEENYPEKELISARMSK